MSDDYSAIAQRQREIDRAEAERFQQAGFLALDQLKHELPRCVTMEQYRAWSERVNALAQEIMARPN